MKRLFGTDGIRGIVNDELTVDLAMRLGNSVARLYNGKYKTLLIAMDTRSSGQMFEAAITTGAISAGMNVIQCGVIPTPSLAFLTKQKNAVGVMISASHNPSIYNGLKVMAQGYKIPDEEEVEIENIILKDHMEYSPYGEIGTVEKDSVKELYYDYVINTFKGIKNSFRFAVDTGNGAAGAVAGRIFKELELDCDIYFNSPDGFNINDRCGSTAPETISKIVREKRYDFGVLFDGDADRCLFVDKNGTLVDGDKLMAINAVKMKQQTRLTGETVVSTVMSNLGFEEYLRGRGIKLYRTQVGDKYVLEKMLEISSNIGGEQSGHIIMLDRSTTGDGLITALETIDTMEFFSKTIDQLVGEIPEYPQVLKNVAVKDKKKIMTDERMTAALKKYETNREIRLLVRPSGTEHKIRVMTEGKDEKLVSETAQEFVELIDIIDKE